MGNQRGDFGRLAEDAHTYRQPGRWRRIGWCVGGPVLTFGVLIFALGMSQGDAIPATVMGVGFSLMGFLAIRPAMSSATVSTEGLEIRNWPRHKFLPWASIAGVSTGFTGRTVLRQRTGRSIAIVALSQNPAYDTRWRTEPLAAIQQRIDHGATPSSGDEYRRPQPSTRGE